MDITQSRTGDVVILDLVGRVTLTQGDEVLRTTIQGLVTQGNRQILLNLAGVSYIDSAGLGALISVHSLVSQAGGQLRLSNLSQRHKDLLALTKLNTILQTFDSTDSAVESFGPRPSV